MIHDDVHLEKELKKIKQNDIIYTLDEDEETAYVFKSDNPNDDILIPRSIIYDTKEFIIIGLLKESFNCSKSIRSIRFPFDSELQFIEKDTFTESNIEEISIPSSIVKIEEGWYNYASKLKKVTIIPTQYQNISYYNGNENIIVGKSDLKSDEYDVLIFVNKDVENITIPKNIKQIASNAFANSLIESIVIPSQIIRIGEKAFSHCLYLQNVKISFDSLLNEIEDDLFECCPIESILIPPHITRIGERAFIGCRNLRYVNFSDESDLQIIEEDAFTYTSIESIIIPPHVFKICKRSFSCCQNLKLVEFDQNSELQIIQQEAFAWSSIEKLTIPANVFQLEDGWCNGTPILTEVTIMPKNHNFINLDEKMIIGKTDLNSHEYDVLYFVCRNIESLVIPSFIKKISSYTFSDSMIKNVIIPSRVKQICHHAFSGCKQLKSIEFEQNSELETIEQNAFEGSSIESISIPSSVAHLNDGWCNNVSKLTEIKVCQSQRNNILNYENKMILGKTNAKNDIFDVLLFVNKNLKKITIPINIKKIGPFAFSESLIESIFIPPQITHISKYAFYKCENLNRVEITYNSELQYIDEQAFSESAIENIVIPHFITKIGVCAFDFCNNLRKIKFAHDSLLQEIVAMSFRSTSITSLLIPSHVKNIQEYSFLGCNKLKIIQFDENSEIDLINILKINFYKIEIIMIPFRT